ncbi:hypothetical protein SO802_000065 [Lithocarpus litseifolius]|uniref:Replication protein A 70 kDa DNA-binding subunit B/D first OB fold domain-containing protein n=1 Tax=Lithocarpus litseifolius TaxID=425828 RepID=A0AAW2DW96_9ROSI
MDRQNQRYNLLDEIDTKKDDWNIKVRVTRMWEVLNIKTNNELMSVDLVLLDEKDNLIHASIRKSFVNHFRDIQEGKIYRIKYFGVVKNKDAYRIVNHKYMIRFYATTSVKLLETNDELIAKKKFELVPFDELKYLADKNTTLTDVIGEIVGISPMEKIEVRGKKLNKRLIELQDNRLREKIRITFWDKFAEAINEDICFDNSVRPILIITSTTVKTYMKTEFSLDEKEKKIESLQLSRSILDPNEISKMKRMLLEILTFIKTEKEHDITFYCTTSIKKINAENGWYYVSCDECPKKLKKHESKLFYGDIIPSSIKCIIGKTYTFQLKITAYNFFVRKQNFTVTRVIEIEGNRKLQDTTKRGANNGNEVLEEKICAQVKKRKIVKKEIKKEKAEDQIEVLEN